MIQAFNKKNSKQNLCINSFLATQTLTINKNKS